MKPNVIVVVLVIVIVVLASALMLVLNGKHESNPAAPLSPSTEAPSPNGPSHTEYLKSSLKDRPSSKYSGPKFYDKLTPSSLTALQAKNVRKNANSSTTSWDSLHCERWAVVTTINAPTTAVQKQAHISAAEAKLVDGVNSGWCLLVVADTGSPDTYELNIPNNKFTYLSVSRQKELANTASRAQKEVYQALPWGHVGRKNAGYLYALNHGARYIYDFDDDVLLLAKQHTIHIPGEAMNPATKTVTVSEHFTTRVPSAPYDAEVFNPFPLFDANHNPSWPRGFPPERILTNSSTHEAPIETSTVKVPKESIGVVQYLANHDPDVDSMYRLMRPLPLDFPLHGVAPLILPGQRSAVDGVKGSTEDGVQKSGAVVRKSRHLTETVAAPVSTGVAGAAGPKNSSADGIPAPRSTGVAGAAGPKNSSTGAAPAPRSVAATAAAKLSASVAHKAATVNKPAPTPPPQLPQLPRPPPQGPQGPQ